MYVYLPLICNYLKIFCLLYLKNKNKLCIHNEIYEKDDEVDKEKVIKTLYESDPLLFNVERMGIFH